VEFFSHHDNRAILEALEKEGVCLANTQKNEAMSGSLIGKTFLVDDSSDLIYLKWSWSDTSLNKSSKVNLVKILKYFLDKEPAENSYVFSLVKDGTSGGSNRNASSNTSMSSL
jgi:hypothetical protein